MPFLTTNCVYHPFIPLWRFAAPEIMERTSYMFIFVPFEQADKPGIHAHY